VPGAYDELVELGPIELARAGGHSLALAFLPPRGLEVALELDGVRLTGHALRRSELEQLVRLAAICSDVPHPGWLLALTSRVAPIVEADGDYPMHMLERAFALTLASDEGASHVIAQSDARGAGITWTKTGERWQVAQAAGHAEGTEFALRGARDGAFPHDQLAEMLAATVPWTTPIVRELARRVAAGDRHSREVLADALRDAGCDRPMILDALAARDRVHEAWVLEFVLGLTPGAILGPMLGASKRPHAQYWRNVCAMFADAAIANRVSASLVGRGYEFDPSEQGELRVRLRGDFEPALARFVAALRWARAPRGTTVAVGIDRFIQV
jgi:hypothetical protein